MNTTKTLEHLTKTFLPPPLARAAKRVAVYPRYMAQVRACREGYQQFGDRYRQKVLFVAGLPKSGTTWLERMLSSYPGFHDLLIPDVTAYEMAMGESHDYDLPLDMFARFEQMLVVTKMHVHGSPHNVALLHRASVKYVVLYRDLRDVALSHYFYVRQTPWHPEYPVYSKLGAADALLTFAAQLLPDFATWVRSWHQNRDAEMGLVVTYEQMLADTEGVLMAIAQHFELDSSPQIIKRIVQAHSFQKLSEGRGQGQENHQSFFRKGVAGDWHNYFTPQIKAIYKQLIGDFLIEFGYEQDYSW